MCDEQAKHEEEAFKKVYINKDLTPKEREEDRKLYEELRDMRAQGRDVIIKNGRIIPCPKRKSSVDKIKSVKS